MAPEEMARRYRRYPEAIANTGRIAERCKAFDLNLDLGYTFPDYPCEPGETPDDALARICSGPFAERYPPESPQRRNAEARLAEELRLIRHHGLAGFFLIHHDLLVLAREVAVEVRGNDSARAQAAPAAGTRTRLIGQLDRLLPDRVVAGRSARTQALTRPFSERADSVHSRYRS
ncbi:MAG: hypothetical protein R2845_08480 [Thermomicrobiales bacterium]